MSATPKGPTAARVCVHSEDNPVHERLCVFQRERRRQLLGRREMTSSGGAPGRQRQVQIKTHNHSTRHKHTHKHALTISLQPPQRTHRCPLCTRVPPAESEVACGGNGDDPDTPNQSDAEEREEEPAPPLASTSEGVGAEPEASTGTVSNTRQQTDRRIKPNV